MQSKQRARAHAKRHSLVWHDKHNLSLTSLADGVQFKTGERKGELRIQPIEATQVVEEKREGEVVYSRVDWIRGDIRPNGIDVISHETERDTSAPNTRLVITLAPHRKTGGFSWAKECLSKASKLYGFRVVEADGLTDKWERPVPGYTITGLTPQALAFLLARRGAWIDWIGETKIRMTGAGAIDHVARKPKRKRASYHPDYTNFRNGFAKLPSRGETRRIIDVS